MNFHIPTAMLLTALTTFVIGAGMAFAASGYPRALQYPIRLWVRGLLIQSVPYLLFSLRGQIPDVLSIVAANSLLVLGIAHQIQALRRFNRQVDRSPVFAGLFALCLIGCTVLTFLWPSIHARIVLISLIIAMICSYGVAAIYRSREDVSRAGHVIAASLLVIITVMLARILRQPDMSMQELTSSTFLQAIVFTCAALMPIMLTSTFMLMCGERLNADLKRLAMIDPLTGVYNRRTMTELANRAIASAQRHARPLSLLTIDIDYFKRINDEFGHEAGDQALCAVVDVMQDALRQSDLIARLGGEEFVVILPDTDESDARLLAERVRHRVEDSGFTASGWPAPLRVSIGVGALGPAAGDLQSLLRETDRALYTAKRAGRNRVVAVSQIGYTVDDAPVETSGAAP